MSLLSGRLWRWRLARSLGKLARERRENLIIPDGLDGWIHVPWVLLRPEGLFVLDLLEGSGQLIAGDLLPEWTVVNRNRFRFPNPLPALQREQAAVKLLVGEEVPVEGFLLLQDGLQLARARPRAIVSLAELAERLPPLATDSTVRPDYRQAWDGLLAASRTGRLG